MRTGIKSILKKRKRSVLRRGPRRNLGNEKKGKPSLLQENDVRKTH